MNISALQKERAKYQPKLPKSLRGAIQMTEGAKTQSVADQDEIAKLFPNTYGMPLIAFEIFNTVPIVEFSERHSADGLGYLLF